MSTRQTLTIQTADDRQRIATWARNVETGTVVTFRKKSRSTDQNAKLHAMLGEVAKQVEWYGQHLDIEDWKDVFTASLRHARVVPGIDKGTFVPLGMHTSTLTIEEMSNLIELIYAFGSEPEHIVIFKDPKDNESGPSSPEEPAPAEDRPSSVSAASDDTAPSLSSDAPLSQADLDWLAIVAKMLWSATVEKGDRKEATRLLETQKMCVPSGKAMSEKAREIARKIYVQLENTAKFGFPKEPKRKVIANYAGISEKELIDG